METQEALDNLTTELVKEGCSDEEITQRVATLKHCIEFGEKMSAKIKEIKAKKVEARKAASISIELRPLIEWGIIVFLAGALGGSLLFQYAEAHR